MNHAALLVALAAQGHAAANRRRLAAEWRAAAARPDAPPLPAAAPASLGVLRRLALRIRPASSRA